MNTTHLDFDMQHHETWTGNMLAWLATIIGWFGVGPPGINWGSALTGVLTITTIIWTIEKIRTERARRRTEELKHAALGEFTRENKTVFARLMNKFTRPGDFE